MNAYPRRTTWEDRGRSLGLSSAASLVLLTADAASTLTLDGKRWRWGAGPGRFLAATVSALVARELLSAAGTGALRLTREGLRASLRLQGVIRD